MLMGELSIVKITFGELSFEKLFCWTVIGLVLCLGELSFGKLLMGELLIVKLTFGVVICKTVFAGLS